MLLLGRVCIVLLACRMHRMHWPHSIEATRGILTAALAYLMPVSGWGIREADVGVDEALRLAREA